MKKGVTATSFNNCILISKRGTLKEIYLTECELNKDHYIKVCATPPTFEKSFKHRTTWHVKKYSFPVELWARTDGRAGQENKYELPPPVDETLFFGDCILVSRAPFTIALWQKIYKHLFGGFDDLTKMADDDDAEIDELETVSEKKKTRDGYLKDGFIVEDSAASAAASRVLHKLKAKTKPKATSDSNTNITIPEISGQRINIGFDEIVLDDYSESSNDDESDDVSSSASQNMNCSDDENSEDNADGKNNDGNSETGNERLGDEVERGDGGGGDHEMDGAGDGDGDGDGDREEEENEITKLRQLKEKSNVNLVIASASKIGPMQAAKSRPKKRVAAVSTNKAKPLLIKKPAKKRTGLAVVSRTNDEDTASELDEEMYV